MMDAGSPPPWSLTEPVLMVHFDWAQYKRQAHHDGWPKGPLRLGRDTFGER